MLAQDIPNRIRNRTRVAVQGVRPRGLGERRRLGGTDWNSRRHYREFVVQVEWVGPGPGYDDMLR